MTFFRNCTVQQNEIKCSQKSEMDTRNEMSCNDKKCKKTLKQIKNKILNNQYVGNFDTGLFS